MKKYVFVFAFGFLAAWQLKGNMSLTQDNQLHLASLTIPIPQAVQTSPVYPMLTMLMQTAAPPQQQCAPQGQYARQGASPYPTQAVTSMVSGFGGATSAAGTPAAASLDTAGRALRSQ